jgi:N-acyl-D-amino-acid deacylase
MHDLVIAGGTLIDGTGAAGRLADVAVDGERIVAVGAPGSMGPAHRTIDAVGKLVTPGFVDVHTHYDAQLSWDPWITPSSWHGCTTVIVGNCGVGFAPARPAGHDELIELMEGVEDIPGAALVEGITWGWESFAEYLDVLEAQPHVIDFGCQIGHGPVRAYVMGERGVRNEPATGDDIDRMAAIVEAGLRAGALGFTTSQTALHKSKSGEYVPGTWVAVEEMLAMADAMARAGLGVFQGAYDHPELPEQFGWLRTFAERSGRPVAVNLNQTDQAPDVWRAALAWLDEMHDADLPVVAEVAGRSIGILMCLEGTVHPFTLHPAYDEIASLPFADRVAELRRPERQARLIDERQPEHGGFLDSLTRNFDKMFPAEGDVIDYEPPPEASARSRAARLGVPPERVVLDALLENDGHGMVYYPLFNYAQGDLGVTYDLHRHPGTRMGLSDGGAHCGAICDGGMPTFMLTHWTRDRTRGPRLPLELVVHRQTQQAALLYDLKDRGVVAPGFRADLNVIDYEHLGFGPPRMAYDFPADARRLVQRASGYEATICAGTVIVEGDEFTGALPGRLVRGPQARPVPAPE